MRGFSVKEIPTLITSIPVKSEKEKLAKDKEKAEKPKDKVQSLCGREIEGDLQTEKADIVMAATRAARANSNEKSDGEGDLPLGSRDVHAPCFRLDVNDGE